MKLIFLCCAVFSGVYSHRYLRIEALDELPEVTDDLEITESPIKSEQLSIPINWKDISSQSSFDRPQHFHENGVEGSIKYLKMNVTSDSDKVKFSYTFNRNDGMVEVESLIPDFKAVIKTKFGFMAKSICFDGDTEVSFDVTNIKVKVKNQVFASKYGLYREYCPTANRQLPRKFNDTAWLEELNTIN